MLVQLCYISDHLGGIIPDLDTFILGARERNTSMQISSILLSTSKYYIHLIEGTRISVNYLYNKISKDPRHANCTILRYVDIRNREFDQWPAEHVSMDDFNVSGINLLLPTGIIDSSIITSTHAVSIIRRIHAHLLVNAGSR